jgi:Holliday junction resolvasome RuvABC DNA-binding subunit
VGCLPGVGPKTAALLVGGLGGSDVRQALSSSNAVARLMGIKGIGAKKAAEIKAAWDKNTGGCGAWCWDGDGGGVKVIAC